MAFRFQHAHSFSAYQTQNSGVALSLGMYPRVPDFVLLPDDVACALPVCCTEIIILFCSFNLSHLVRLSFFKPFPSPLHTRAPSLASASPSDAATPCHGMLEYADSHSEKRICRASLMT